jgi:8-oxo-dGTP pyrophosphatase MutT (NUDIX family)
VDVVDTWTGRAASALQQALRMTNEQFAQHLDIAVRTVASWHADPDVIPRNDTQQLLDTAYERTTPSVLRRFNALYRPSAEISQAQAFRVAVAVVLRGSDVLLVCRRGDESLSWQFPAGTVKPGRNAELVAVEETRAETGIRCAIRQRLGERVHPKTGVLVEYHLAEYLMGEAENRDPDENSDVAWVPRADLTRFIPEQHIYPPILEALA